MHVYNGYLWTNIEIIYHQMKKTWHEHPAEALKISQKPWQHMHNHPSPNLNSEDRCSDFLWYLSHCDAFHDSASYCRDQDFFSRKKGGAFFQQSSSVKMPLANLTVSCLVVPSSLTASREGSFLFELSKLLDSPEVLCSLGNGHESQKGGLYTFI